MLKKLTLSGTIIFLIFVSPSFADLNDGLVAYYEFNELSGDSAYDSSGNGHHGTVFGAVWEPGVIFNCLRFDGNDDRVVVAHAADLSFTSSESFSVSAWAYVPSQSYQFKAIVAKSRDIPQWYGIWTSNENRWVFGSNSYNIDGDIVEIGWHLVTAVQDVAHNARYLYVDGALCASGSLRNANGAGELWIGAAKSMNEYFEGSIDDVRIYDRVLSPAEIQTLYNMSVPYDGYIDHTSLPDMNLNGHPEIAVLRVTFRDNPIVYIKDCITDKMIKKIHFFNELWIPKSISIIEDINDNNFPEISVLARHTISGALQVEIRDVFTEEVITRVSFPDTVRFQE